jgi:PAS domain S-box-containing protein
MMGTLVSIDERQQSQLLLQQQLEQQRLVMEITQRIRQSLSLSDILQTTVDEVRQFLQVDRVIIFRFAADWGGTVTVESVVDEALAILPFNIYDPCIGDSYVEPFKQGLVTAKSDIYNADISPCHVDFLAQFQVRANLVVPILKNDELWGLLAAHQCMAPRLWQSSEIELLKQISTQVSIALQQAALFEQVQTELKERKQAEHALQQLNAELEQRVAERTIELTQVNDRLLNALAEQQHIQLLLAKSEESRRLALDMTHLAFWDWDLSSDQMTWNNNHFTLLGLTPDDVVPSYELWRSHIHPDDLAWVEQRFLDTIATHADYAAEYRVIHPDGSLHWLMARAQATYDETGQPLRSLGVLLDISDRKAIEEALRQSDEKFRQLADNIEAVFWMRDVQQQQVVYVSPAYEEIWQKSCESLYQNFSDWIDAIHPGDRARVETAALELTTIGHYDQEYRILRPDGSTRWIRDRAFSIRNEAGEIVRVAGLAEDITVRKQVETALQQQTRQEQLRWNITQAIRQSLDLSVVLNTAVMEARQTLQVDRVAVYRFHPDWGGDFIVESVNCGWVKLVEADVPKAWDDTYLQETQGGRFQYHETFVISDIYTAGLQPCHIELLEQFQVNAYAVAPIFSGEVLWGLLAIYQNTAARDWQSWEIDLLQQIASQLSIAIQQSELYSQLQVELQERKQAAAVLREAERRWRSLLDNVQLVVVGLNQSGIVNYVNPFFLSLSGYTQSEVLGKNWFEHFLPPQKQASMQTVFSEVLTQNAHPYHQNSILTKSGDERFIAWNNTMLQDSSGATIGTISIGEDITDRQKVEKMKNEFVSIVSHELRTPLTSIRGSLGLLATGIMDDEPDEMRRMIEIAAIDTERLVRLVNDVLDLEKLESGKVSLVREWCDAADLVRRSLEVMESSAQEADVQLVMHPISTQIWVTPDRIIQTLTNLLSNAIKFSPPGGTVTVSAEVRRQRSDGNDLDPWLVEAGDLGSPCILFSVHDQGRGIPADKLDTIFGRFQQVDASDSRDKGGTGLGLAICKSIVQQHDGHIWVESSWGQGSTFFFTLPLQTQ